ncbi:MAG: NAD(P)-dependent oxidoreductase [Chloroflexi bacterium]|nr:NAD(P)-dependent oxidoreductase [Chloroflexota bacterium]
MTTLVTGAAGLVGHQVCRLLHGMGRPVVGYDRVVPADALDGVPYVRGDVLDTPRLFGAVKAHGVDAIVHAGGISGPMVETDNPFLIVQTNVMGTANVFEAARTFGVRRVVYCGSGSSFGSAPTDVPLTEETPLRPGDVYGATKAAGDVLSWAYQVQHGLDVVVLRFASVYGPRRATACVIHQMIRDALAGRETVFPAGATHGMNHVYVTDCALGVICAIDAPRPAAHRAYHISSGEWNRLPEVARIVQQVLPAARITVGPGPLPGSNSHGPASIEPARADLGYTPKYTLEAGITEYAAWLQAHAR